MRSIRDKSEGCGYNFTGFNLQTRDASSQDYRYFSQSSRVDDALTRDSRAITKQRLTAQSFHYLTVEH